mgnify:CR=1 FL=1
MPVINFDITPNNAAAFVTDGWDSAQAYARDAYTKALGFLDALQNAAVGIEKDKLAFEKVTLPNPGNTTFARLSVPTAPQAYFSSPGAPIASIRPYVAPTPPDSLSSAFMFAMPDVPIAPTASFVMPVVPDAPTSDFLFVEPAYFSPLLAAIQTQLTAWSSDISTGLSPVVEQALWERARARENTAMLLGVDAAYREAASKGFNLPSGALFARVDAAIQDTTNKNSALSRDIAIKQAELEQTNKHFAVDTSVKLETLLMGYSNNVAQRSFEVAKSTLDAAVKLYEARTKAFDSQVAGETARIGAQVSIYTAEVKAFESLITGEAARIGAEVSLFDARVKSFGAQVTGETARLTGEVSAYDASVKAFVAQITGETARVGAEVNLYDSQIKAFSAQVAGEAARVGTVIDAYKTESGNVLGVAGLSVEVIKAKVSAMQTATTAIIEAMRSGAATAAQLAASALSVVNLSGSLSDSMSTSQNKSIQVSESLSNSISTSTSTIYDYKGEI